MVKSYSAAGVRQGINLKDVQLTCRDTRTFLLNLNQNQNVLDLDLKFNYKGKEEDIKVNGALDFPSQSGWTLKGTVSSSLSDLVNAQLDVETSSRSGLDRKRSATLKLRNGGVISYTYLWEDKGSVKETSRTFDGTCVEIRGLVFVHPWSGLMTKLCFQSSFPHEDSTET